MPPLGNLLPDQLAFAPDVGTVQLAGLFDVVHVTVAIWPVVSVCGEIDNVTVGTATADTDTDTAGLVPALFAHIRVKV